MSDIKAKLHTGELYFPDDEEITKEQRIYQDLLYEYNHTKPSEGEKRTALLRKMLGPNVTIATAGHPFYRSFAKRDFNIICRFISA